MHNRQWPLKTYRAAQSLHRHPMCAGHRLLQLGQRLSIRSCFTMCHMAAYRPQSSPWMYPKTRRERFSLVHQHSMFRYHLAGNHQPCVRGHLLGQRHSRSRHRIHSHNHRQIHPRSNRRMHSRSNRHIRRCSQRNNKSRSRRALRLLRCLHHRKPF